MSRDGAGYYRVIQGAKLLRGDTRMPFWGRVKEVKRRRGGIVSWEYRRVRVEGMLEQAGREILGLGETLAKVVMMRLEVVM